MSLNTNTFGNLLFGDILGTPILQVTEERYVPQIQAFIAQENAFVSTLMSVLCDEGTDLQTGYTTNMGGRMQRLGAIGSVEATKGGKPWYVGFPIFAYGNKEIYSKAFLERALVWQIATSMLNAVLMDIETVIVEAFNAIFRNTGYVFDDSQWPGIKAQSLNASVPINVYPLANNDSSVGSVYAVGKEIQIGTLNHYLVSGTANFAKGNFDTCRAALRNVGLGKDIVYIVSRASADYLVNNVAEFILPTEILNTQIRDPFGKYGFTSAPTARGRISFGEVVEWPHFPDNYIFAYDRAAEPPLRRRVSDLSQYAGLTLINDDELPDVQTHPLLNKQWRRVMGYGARNRVNGVIMQIKASGNYDIPTF